jgi:hypothetical protein
MCDEAGALNRAPIDATETCMSTALDGSKRVLKSFRTGDAWVQLPGTRIREAR